MCSMAVTAVLQTMTIRSTAMHARKRNGRVYAPQPDICPCTLLVRSRAARRGLHQLPMNLLRYLQHSCQQRRQRHPRAIVR